TSLRRPASFDPRYRPYSGARSRPVFLGGLLVFSLARILARLRLRLVLVLDDLERFHLAIDILEPDGRVAPLLHDVNQCGDTDNVTLGDAFLKLPDRVTRHLLNVDRFFQAEAPEFVLDAFELEPAGSFRGGSVLLCHYGSPDPIPGLEQR